jgi:hypothetical protein
MTTTATDEITCQYCGGIMTRAPHNTPTLVRLICKRCNARETILKEE